MQQKSALWVGWQLVFAKLLFLSCHVHLYAADSGCLDCHKDVSVSLNPHHQFSNTTCSSCHKGDEKTSNEVQAHLGFIKSPGELDNAEEACGACHPDHVKGVLTSKMHTGSGIVTKTRADLEPGNKFQQDASFQTLGHGIADSLLRKQCASCHLGQHRDKANKDMVKARGGGCLACHLIKKTNGTHPGLIVQVSDAQCFGCHSRSGRVALSYAGLAEVDEESLEDPSNKHARLSDGRLVRHETPDVHHKAGMSCIDCHTAKGLMNLKDEGETSGVDIKCTDCHDNGEQRLTLQDWPPANQSMKARIPFDITSDQVFIQTENGTPLWHIQVVNDSLILYPKLGGDPRIIPTLSEQHNEVTEGHERLSCDTCHATWMPQCLGCHIEYDPDQEQWDHQARAVTRGRWHEKRWSIGTAGPTLGLLDGKRVGIFMPGMIMTMDHPDMKKTHFIRDYASLSPHTTGVARDCETCHRSSLALGLGEGRLKEVDGQLEFSPGRKRLADGLPEDAWGSLIPGGLEAEGYPRPFTPAEIRTIYKAELKKAPNK